MKVLTATIPIVQVIIIGASRLFLPTPFRIFGIFISLLRIILSIPSIITMKASWGAGVAKNEKTTLITNGIYAFSRNPAFVGFDLMYLGIVCLFFSWILLILSMIEIVVFHLQIIYVEERFLGQPYLEYTQQVCRYLGRKKKLA